MAAPIEPVRADEGRRVLRNVASFGAFAMSPIVMLLLIRALGPEGYGRWWSAFVVLEAVGYLGMTGSDLYVRREVARLTREGRDDEVAAVVGSALAVVGMCGAVLAGAQLALAHQIAAAQDDPGLAIYLIVPAVQPMLGNLSGVLVGALQSRDILGWLAVLRGIVFPILTAGVLFVAWQTGAPAWLALLLLVGVTLSGLTLVAVLYSRHLSLARTLRFVWRPHHARAVFHYGSRLMLPIALFVIGGKLDLYVLGAHYDAIVVGVYAGCLQIASGLPNTRALLDPVIMTRVGALYAAEPKQLGASLQRLTRLCAFALAPGFVLLIAIGQPVLGWMIGHPVPEALIPLTILTVGQLVGSMAVASWIVPLMLPARVLVVIALTTLVVKLALLFALVPSFGLIGAAVATAIGTVISMQGQALTGAWHLGLRPYAMNLMLLVAIAVAAGVGGRELYGLLQSVYDPASAVAIAGGAALVGLGLLLFGVLDAGERAALREFLALAPRAFRR